MLYQNLKKYCPNCMKQPYFQRYTSEKVITSWNCIQIVATSPHSPHIRIELTITGCRGARNISDDILVWGKNQHEHDKNLQSVLRKLSENNLKLNKEKCIFSADTIVFAGHKLTSRGISPEKSKIDPTNATEIRSFHGLVNFCQRFIQNYSTITEPLRRLTKK